MVTAEELAVLNPQERQEALKALSYIELLTLRRNAIRNNLSWLSLDIKIFMNTPRPYSELADKNIGSICTTERQPDEQPTLAELYDFRLSCMEHGGKERLLNAKIALLQMSAGSELPGKNTTIEEITRFEPPVIKVIVDHFITDTPKAETASQEFSVIINKMFGDKVKVVMHSGPYNTKLMQEDHVVLLALPLGFGVLKARQTCEAGKVIPYSTMVQS